MIQLSEQMERISKQKPDSDYCQKWHSSAVTQWLIEQLQITHQQALEELRDIAMLTTEQDVKRMYQLQAAAIQVSEILNTIDSLKKKEGDE